MKNYWTYTLTFFIFFVRPTVRVRLTSFQNSEQSCMAQHQDNSRGRKNDVVCSVISGRGSIYLGQTGRSGSLRSTGPYAYVALSGRCIEQTYP